MRAVSLLFLLLTWSSAGCGSALAPDEISAGLTRLTGLVVRGPLQPVCQVNVPCDGPFSADFTVQQDGRVVATFRSNAQGRFDVPLASGAYLIVPSQSAPIMSPDRQAKVVVVGPDGLTSVRLEFDTGIR